MHEIDYDLISRAEQNIRKVISKDTKNYLRNILGKYKLACKLSNGPDLSRSKYWASEARSIERKIAKVLNPSKTDCC